MDSPRAATTGSHDAPRTGRRRRLVTGMAIAAGFCVCLAGAAAFMLWPRGATPISEGDALDDFRNTERASESDTGDRDATPAPKAESPPTRAPKPDAPSSAAAGERPGATVRDEPARSQQTDAPGDAGRSEVPAAGVYTYDARGYERVHLGPAKQTRDLGATVTAIVRPAADCWTFTHNIFAEHIEDTTYCSDADGSLDMTKHEKRQKLGAVTARAEMTCTPPDLLDGRPAPGRRSDSRCEMQTRTPLFTATTTQRGTTTVVGAAGVNVGDREVPAWHVRIRRMVSGDLNGHWHEDLWFAQADGLVVKIVRDAELRGPATFREESTFTLRSLQPST